MATTGRALNGTFLPLYFQAGIYNSWFMPVIYYAIALALQVLPLAEWSIRVPTVLAGILSIALTYFLGRRLYGDRVSAVVAAAVLACAPAFFILSRYALDYTLSVPFILGWLWCLAVALQRPYSPRWIAGAGLSLGLGWYAYISSIVMMPVYLVLTVAVLIARKRDRREIIAAVAMFALALVPFAAWLIQHPQAVGDTLRRYSFEASFDVWAMLARYVNFFRIEFLFQLGDTYLPFSTRTTGVFVGGAGILIAVGIYAALVTFRSAMALLVLSGFLLSPLAASVLRDEGAIRRATGMLLFGALLAGFGAAQLRRVAVVPFFKPIALTVAGVGLAAGLAVMARTALTQGRISETASKVIVIAMVAAIIATLSTRVRHGALVVAAVVLVVVWQFVSFQRGYHGEYMSRVAVWLQGNTRGALERLVAESDTRPQAPIYFATLRNGQGGWEQRNLYIPHYWRFYATKWRRQDLQQRAVFVEITSDPLAVVPKGSVMLASVEDPNVRRLQADGARRIADIPEVAQDPYYTIVVR